MNAIQRERRWRQEAAFFDAMAGMELGDLATSPAVLERYARANRWLYPKEYVFHLIGDVMGKKVLDLGCGMGQNTSLLALRGANVTGLDISPRSIEVARLRAERDGVEHKTQFVCGPVEAVHLQRNSFDVIWGDAVLHHLIDSLDIVLQRVIHWCKPGGMVIFSEPVTFIQAVRKIRLMLPVPLEGTPDERPLEESEMRLMRHYLPGMEVRAFGLLGRFGKFVLPGNNYEAAPPARQKLADLLYGVDYAMLSIPAIQRLGATAVFSATIQK